MLAPPQGELHANYLADNLHAYTLCINAWGCWYNDSHYTMYVDTISADEISAQYLLMTRNFISSWLQISHLNGTSIIQQHK